MIRSLKKRTKKSTKPTRRRRLRAEMLEERRLLAGDQPILIVDDLEVLEGNDGTARAVIPVGLDREPTEAVELTFQTVAKSASSGSDFTPSQGVLAWNAGDFSTQFIIVDIAGDADLELNEELEIEFNFGVNVALPAESPKVTILDDDAPLPNTPLGSPFYADFAWNTLRAANDNEKIWGYDDGPVFTEFQGDLYFQAYTERFDTPTNSFDKLYKDEFGRVINDPTRIWRLDSATQEYALVDELPQRGVYGELQVVGENLIFRQYVGSGTYNLYSWKGLETSPVLLGTTVKPVEVVGERFLFEQDGILGEEVWISNGETGPANTYLLIDTVPGPGDGNLGPSTIGVDGEFYFQGGGGIQSFGLFVSDGTPEGTVKLINGAVLTSDIYALDGKAYFSAFDEASSEFRFYRTDNTPSGTVSVTLESGSPLERVIPIGVIGDRLFLRGDAGDGEELWTFDGNELELFYAIDGTETVRGAERPRRLLPNELRSLGNELWSFEGFLPDTTPSVQGIWLTDGTKDGTRPLDFPDRFAQNMALFGDELWKWNHDALDLAELNGESTIRKPFERPSELPDVNYGPVLGRIAEGSRIQYGNSRYTVSWLYDIPFEEAGIFSLIAKPQAILTPSLTVDEGDTAFLDAFSSIALHPQYQSFSWDLDYDGLTFTEDLTDTSYVAIDAIDGPAMRTVALRITDVWGNESIATSEITIENSPPVIEGIKDYSVAAGEAATVSADFFDPGQSDSVSVLWDLGDNQTTFNDVTTFTHTYAAPGEYNVNVQATDSDGAITEATFRVVVGPDVTISVSESTVGESEIVTITASVNAPLSSDVTIPLAFNGTATPLTDFTDASVPGEVPNSITIPANALNASIQLAIVQDSLNELGEVITITPGVPSNASLKSDAALVISLLDDDPEPTVFVASSPQVLQESETTIPIAIELSEPSGRDVLISLELGGTIDSQDAVLSETLLLIPAGEIRADTTLSIVDDAVAEPSEQLDVIVAAAQNAGIAEPPFERWIVEANDAPTMQFNAALREVSETTDQESIRVTLSNPASFEITASVGFGGDAMRGIDFELATSNPTISISFAPGETEFDIPLQLVNDTDVEADELIVASLSSISGALTGDTLVGIMRISDDDSKYVTLSTVSSVWEDEQSFEIVATLNAPSLVDTVIPLTYSGNATRGIDFEPGFDSLTIPAGDESAILLVGLAADDQIPESNRSIVVTASDPATAQLRSPRNLRVDIKDNDPVIFLEESSQQSLSEGERRTFRVRTDRPSNRDITIPLQGISVSTTRFDFFTDDSVTIEAHSRTATFEVDASDDGILEGTEFFQIRLGNPSVGATSDNQSQNRLDFEIIDNDPAPRPYWAFPEMVVQEGASTLLLIRAGLRGRAEVPVLAELTVGGSASYGADYAIVGLDTGSGTLTFAPDEREKLILLEIRDDGIYEGLEWIDLYLTTQGQTPQKYSIPLNDNESEPREPRWWERASDAIQSNVVRPFTDAISTGVLGEFWASFSSGGPFQGGPDWELCLSAEVLSDFDFLGWFEFGVTASGCITPATLQRIQNEWDLFVSGGIKDPVVMHGFPEEAIVFIDRNFNEILDFYDENSNGIQDSGEPPEAVSRTAYDGATSLNLTADLDTDQSGTFDDDEFQLVSRGGTDISTGLPLSIPLSAPASYSIISPLSTLVAKTRLAQSSSTEDAEIAVAAALGIQDPAYLNQNLIESAALGDLAAADAFKTNVVIYSSAIQLSRFIQGVEPSINLDVIGSAVLTNFARKLAAEGSVLDLTVPELLEDSLRSTARTLAIELPTGDEVQAASRAVGVANSAILNVTSTDGRDYLESVARVQQVSEGTLAERLRDLADGSVGVSDIESEFSNEQIELKAAAATIGNVIAPTIFSSDASIVEGDSGETYLSFELGISHASNVPVTVDFATQDVSANAGEDFGQVSGTLAWEIGDVTPRTVQIPIFGDTNSEPDETFQLVLTNSVSADVLASVYVGTIQSDDALELNSSTGSTQQNLTLTVSETILLQESGDVLFEGGYSGEAPLLVQAVNNVPTSLTVIVDSRDSVSRNHLLYLGNGEASSLIIESRQFAEIEHVQTSSESGLFVIDDVVLRYENVGTIVSPISPTLVELPVGEVLYDDTISLTGTPPTLFDSELPISESWTVFLEGDEQLTVGGNTIELPIDAVGTYRLTYTASQEGRLPAVGSYEFTVINAPPIAADDAFATDEDLAVSRDAGLGLLANDSDQTAGPMVVSSVNGNATPVAQPFEFASAAIDPSIPYLATSLNDTNYYGVRFEVTETLDVDQVGGNFQFFSGTGPFAAIVALDNNTDLPDSVDLSTPDVLATTIVPLAFQDDGDKRSDLDITLEPGWYALMFGTGKFGSTGITNLLLNNDPLLTNQDYLHARVAVPEFFPISQASSTWKARFVLEGTSGNDAPITLPSGAIVTVDTDGSFTYDPNNQFEALDGNNVATDTFTYTVTDREGLSSQATVTLTIQGVNDAPAPTDDNYVVSEESLLSPAPSVGVLVNDTDVDGTTLSLTQIDGRQFTGEIRLTSGATVTPATEPNRFIYDPRTVFNYLTTGQTATDSFTYQVSDAGGATATATVSLTINGWNDDPIARDDTYEVSEQLLLSTSANKRLTSNDSDPEGSMVTLLEINGQTFDTTLPLGSGATITPGTLPDSFIYDPRSAFDYLLEGETAEEIFAYKITDATGKTATANATITINGVDDPAVITGSGQASIGEDNDILTGSLRVADPDFGQAFFRTQSGVTGVYGTFSLNENGDWSFDLDNTVTNLLDQDESATETFVVESLDGSASQPLEITIIGGADADTDGVDDAIEDLIGDGNGDGLNDSQQDNVASLRNAVTETTVTLATAAGTSLVGVVASDPQLLVEQPPTDVQLPIGLLQFTVLVDVGEATTVRLFYDSSEPVNAIFKYGQVPGGGVGYYEFTNVSFGVDARGNSYVDLQLIDGGLGDADGLANGQIVDPVGLALIPGMGDDFVSTLEDQSLTFDPLVNDVLTAPITITSVSTPTAGTASINSDGTITYVPSDDFFGNDSIEYAVSDGTGFTGTAVVSLTVLPVNDSPTISVVSAGISVSEGETAEISGSFGDVDAGDVVELNASVGTVVGDGAGSWTWSLLTQDSDQTQVVTITATDSEGATASTSFELNVRNEDPEIATLSSSATLDNRSVDGDVNINGAFADKGITDTHEAVVDWGDGSAPETISLVDLADGTGSFTGAHQYESGGIYTITVTLTDDDGGVDVEEVTAYVVGVGIDDNVLQIVGTVGRDRIKVDQRSTNYRVRTKLHGQTTVRETFDASAISSILILAGDGNDRIDVRNHADTPVVVYGGGGNDDIETRDGDDMIVDLAGDNSIRSGSGDDEVITGDGDDSIRTDDGNDIIRAGSGNNHIWSGRGDDEVIAGNGNDWIAADAGDDVILAGDGNNVVWAGFGSDIVVAGIGNDWIHGGFGDDLIVAGAGRDVVFGGWGRDLLIAGSTQNDHDTSSLDNALTSWRAKDLDAALASLGQIEDDEEKDRIFGGFGRDEVVSGLGDRSFT